MGDRNAMSEGHAASFKVARLPPGSKNDYTWTELDQPHRWRRHEILKRYPEIKDLYGYDPMTKWAVASMVLGQVWACWYLSDKSWTVLMLVAYCFGGVINHSMTLAIHEITHGLAFESFEHNQWLAIFANLPIGIAECIMFRKYHFDHHTYQGIPGLDVDIPSYTEGNYFTSVLLKMVYVCGFPLHYSLRPLVIRPKAPGRWEVYNWIAQLAFNAAIVYVCGWRSLLYLLICTIIGLGPHPICGHFIAEHYVFHDNQQETYSYYGPFNFVGYDVGYHNEHHDFPRIPGSRLAKVREIASEFYDVMPHHTSWFRVVLDFIFYPVMKPTSRIARESTFGQ